MSKETESRIKQVEAKSNYYNIMISEVKDYAIIMLDPDGKVISWNKGAQNIKGYTSEEIIGKHFSRFYTQEDIENGKPDKELKTAATTGRFEDEGWRVRKDGSQFIANVIITALRNEKGELVGFSKITRDITESKNAEEELRKAQEKVTQAAQEILEVANPIVPVFEEVLVLPIVGTLDSQRTQRIMENLLQTIVDTQSKVVIIDITGVPVVDTLVATHLLKTADAVRLLGAQAIITGISPTVAQTLVTLGVDLSEMTTRSRLIDGVKLSMKILNRKIVNSNQE